MATSRELDRLIRTLLAQQTQREYVVHYLMESYQLSLPDAQAAVERVAPAAGRLKQNSRFVTPMPEGGPKKTSFF